MKQILTALALAAGALTLGAAPAEAAAPTLTVADAPYVAGGCTHPAYSYDAAPPPGYTEVTVSLSANSSDFATTVFESRDGATGSGAFNLCQAAPGAYSADMDVFACTASYSSCIDYAGPTVSFYVGQRPGPVPAAAVHVTLHASARATRPDQLVKFRAKATVSGGSYAAPTRAAFDRAYLQVKSGSKWRMVKGSKKFLNQRGSGSWAYRVPGSRLQIRVVVKDVVTGVSRPVTLT